MCWPHADFSLSAVFPPVQQVGGIVFQKAVTGRFLQPVPRSFQSIAESIKKKAPLGFTCRASRTLVFPVQFMGFALVHYPSITPASASAEAGVRQEYDRILLQPCHTSPFFRLCCWALSCLSPQRRHRLNKPPMRVRSCSKFLHRPVCLPSSRILALMRNRCSPR